MNKCPNYRVMLIGIEQGKRKIARARCKQWSCEYCAEISVNKWRSRLRFALNKTEGDWQFVTFTASKNWRGAERSYQNVKVNSGKLWKRLARLAKKATTEKMHYVRILEAHKDGSVHVHGFVRAPLTMYPDSVKNPSKKRTKAERDGIRWWKDNSAECGMGYQCDVKLIDSSRAAVNYVTKYMTKSVFELQLPKNARRIQTSVRFPVADWMNNPQEGSWYVVRDGLPHTELLWWWSQGIDVYDCDHRKTVTTDDIGSGEYYL